MVPQPQKDTSHQSTSLRYVRRTASRDRVSEKSSHDPSKTNRPEFMTVMVWA